MALLLSNRINAVGVRTPATNRVVQPRPVVLVRSTDTETQQKTEVSTEGPTEGMVKPTEVGVPRALDFTASRQGGEGYVEKDTAGQSNMYPVVTRPFEAGSAADTTANSSFNSTLALGAGALAAGLVATGLIAQTDAPQAKPAAIAEAQAVQYKPLSQYASAFASELGVSKPKPAPAPAAAPEPAPAADVPAPVEALEEAAAQLPAVTAQ